MSAGKLYRNAINVQPFGNAMSFLRLAMTVFAMLLIVAGNASSFAQQLDRVGLKQQWFTHSGITAGGKLTDWYLDIDPNQATTYFEIVGGEYSETLSENDLGPNGVPMGIELGLELANIKAEVVAARLKSDTGNDVAVSVNQYSLPKSTLYIQTDSGIVRSINAETGKVRWSTSVGKSTSESLGVAGSGKYVAVLKGASVFCLSSETGAILWGRRCTNAASAPPQVDGDKIYVPLINGRIERFDVNEEGFNSFSLIAGGSGAVTTRVALSPASICWSNHSGTVSFAALNSNGGKPGFELKAQGAVFGVPQYKNGIYFVTSIDSYIYALSEFRGSLLWENSTGFEITQAPIVLGNHVYVINDLNQMFRFDAKTGLISADWEKPRPGIGTFIGASRTKIYTVDKLGRVMALDQKSGAVTGSASVGQVALVLPNTKNDRIYLLNNTGTIRCFRETNSVKPFFHSDEFVAIEADKPKTMEPGESNEGRPDLDDNPFADASDGSDENDPFADADSGNIGNGDPCDVDNDDSLDNEDPFSGGDNEPPKDNEDPFSGGDEPSTDSEDPFSGGDDEPSKDNDDPFDGSDDPFESDDPFAESPL